MIIKIERSGGFSGIPTCSSMNSEDLPAPLAAKAKKVLQNQKFNLYSNVIPKSSADYFNYRITIQDGPNQNIIECNQLNIQDDLRSIVKYIERYSKKGK